MKKTSTYIAFALGALGIIVTFVTAKSYLQLAIAAALYPLFAYFAFKLFPVIAGSGGVVIRPQHSHTDDPEDEHNEKGIKTHKAKDGAVVVDIERRAFLKVIGGAGLSIFLFSLLGNGLQRALFGSETAQSLIGEAPQQAPSSSQSFFQGYNISEIDEGVVSYYGFTNVSGAWIIMREDSENNSFRYAKGDTDFSGNWQIRQRLNYDYYHNL